MYRTLRQALLARQVARRPVNQVLQIVNQTMRYQTQVRPMKNSRVANSNDVFGQQQFTVLQISLSRADFFGLRIYIKASQANYYCNLGGFLIQWAGKPSDLFKVLPEEIYEKISIFLVG